MAQARWGGIAGFWSWWRAGLLAWLPQRWRNRSGNGSQRLLLQPSADGLRLGLQRQQQLHWLASVPLPVTPEQLHTVLDRSLHGVPLYWLLLPEQALRRSLRLPQAALPRLREVVGFEVDRQTPFSAGQVEYDARLLGSAGADQIAVELVVLPQQRLEQALAQAGPLAASLAGIDVADGADGSLAVNLLPQALRARRRARSKLPVLVVCLLACVLLGLAGERVLDNRAAAVEALQQQVQQQARHARTVASERQQLQSLVDGVRFFDAQRAARPTNVEVWEELSARLPDGTHLEKLAIEGDQLQLIGMSDQAATLVSALEGTALWSRPALTGVLQSEPGQRRDRFTLGATLGNPAAAPAAAVQGGRTDAR